MIRDDQEIGDDWGSHYLHENSDQDGLRRLLPEVDECRLDYSGGLELMRRMYGAARQT